MARHSEARPGGEARQGGARRQDEETRWGKGTRQGEGMNVVLDKGACLCGGFLPDSRRLSDYSPNHSKTPVIYDNMVGM